MPPQLLQPRSSKALSYAPQAPPRLPIPLQLPPLGFPSPTNDPLQAPPPFTTSTVPTLLSFPAQLLHTLPIHSILLIPVNPSTSPPLLTLRYPQAPLTPLSPFATPSFAAGSPSSKCFNHSFLLLRILLRPRCFNPAQPAPLVCPRGPGHTST